MRGTSFFDTHLGAPLAEVLALPRDRAAALFRGRIPDLLWFLRQGAPPGAARGEPRRTQHLAASLEAALVAATRPAGAELQNLRDRIVTDGFMRSELDRDQNVYLGPFFTRVLTRAVPDVVFQPRTHQEVEAVLAWARRHRVGIATRGAGSTALGGAVPNDGGLLLEMSRFDAVVVDRADGVAVIGAGARLRQIHEKLAVQGLALPSYPSNQGGTLAGWFSAGGLGLNSFKHGRFETQVRALSLVLPRGEHVRFHDDGRLDVLSPEPRRLVADAAGAWLERHGYPALRLADLALAEGQFGVILTLSVRVQPLPQLVPSFFEFESEADAIAFARWAADHAAERGCPPANLEFLSAAHVAAVRRIRGDGGRTARPSVYFDFDAADAAERFASRLASGSNRWRVASDDAEARRWLADRFRPQQTKRLGPGYLASEILLPSEHLAAFLEEASKVAGRVGVHLESEVYFLGDARVLAIVGYTSRGPRRGFMWELVLAPVLLDLAMARFRGEPYVLGRWQSPYFRRKHGAETAKRRRSYKKRVDREGILNPGVYFAPLFRLPGAHGFFRAAFPGSVRLLRGLYGSPLTGWYFRALMRPSGGHPGPGRPPGAAASAAPRDTVRRAAETVRWNGPQLAHAARGCANCGECNAVCPVFDDAKIRLPQMLTHLGERLRGAGPGAGFGGTEQLLLDLCMRCGNCQEVCQADVPHLPLYAAMEKRAGAFDDRRRERQVASLSHLRHSERYLRDFLQVRPGGYLNRTPASLPGEVRYVLFRTENDAGPVDSCVHCGACVTVCPTAANLEFQEHGDPRRITTDLARCIGCGTCVEVCPANRENDGRTLRVMEAPSREFFAVLAAVDAQIGAAATIAVPSRTGGDAR
jgi:glycolate oxidase